MLYSKYRIDYCYSKVLSCECCGEDFEDGEMMLKKKKEKSLYHIYCFNYTFENSKQLKDPTKIQGFDNLEVDDQIRVKMMLGPKPVVENDEDETIAKKLRLEVDESSTGREKNATENFIEKSKHISTDKKTHEPRFALKRKAVENFE